VLQLRRALETLLAGLHRRGVRELGRHGCRWAERRAWSWGLGAAARGGRQGRRRRRWELGLRLYVSDGAYELRDPPRPNGGPNTAQ
jgi:hypothetical protein